MKVFISWSGELSRLVAELLDSWLKNTIAGIDTWISTEDIEKGSLWFLDIKTELAESSVGIICLTIENKDAPWVLFEAGALAKGLTTSRVCPLLINLSPQDLIQPLGQFQATRPEMNDMLQLVKTINKHCMQNRISEQILKNNFNKWWDDFDKGFKEIISSHKPDKEFQKRTERDILEEILEISRVIKRNIQKGGTADITGHVQVIPSTAGVWSGVVGPTLYQTSEETPVVSFGQTGPTQYVYPVHIPFPPPVEEKLIERPIEEKPKQRRKVSKKTKSNTK